MIKKCNICGKKVDAAWLSRHIKNVHPEKVEDGENKQNPEPRVKDIVEIDRFMEDLFSDLTTLTIEDIDKHIVESVKFGDWLLSQVLARIREIKMLLSKPKGS